MNTKKTTAETSVIPRHQWTHDGNEVLLVKFVENDGRSYGDFMWPLTVGATVDAPDWNDRAECGGGLHGWPWGFCIGTGKTSDWSATWLVFGADPKDIIDISGKAKARRGVVRFVGDWQAAMAFVLAGQMAWVVHASHGAALATGRSGAASATGENGAAVVTGINGKVRGGPWGCLALAWRNQATLRNEMRCARIGIGDASDGLLKANVWYRLDEIGEFVEVS